MKASFILVYAMLLIVSSLMGGIVFDEPITVFEAENLAVTKEIKPLPGGNLLLIFSKHIEGQATSHIQVFSPQYQPVWDTAIPVPQLTDVAIHNDGKIAALRELWHGSFMVDTYSPAGDMIESLSGIPLHCYYSSYARLTADNTGGLHFLESTNGASRYHYINNQGVFLTPQYGLELVAESCSVFDSFHCTSDGGALIAIRRSGVFTVYKIGANHQLAGSTNFEFTGTISYLKLHLRSDGSFYVVWDGANTANANLVSSTGQKLWTETYVTNDGIVPKIEGSGVDQAGNLILHYLGQGSEYPERGRRYMRVINSEAETVYSEIPDPSAPLVYPMKMQLFPESAGGWFVLATEDEEQVFPAHFIKHYDSSYQSWQDSVLVTNPGNDKVYAFPSDNALVLNYYKEEAEVSHILVQKVNSEGALMYPDTGLAMLTGAVGIISELNSLHLSNGALFMTWIHNYPAGTRSLKYQAISPSGQTYFPIPQTLAATYARQCTIYETNSSDVLVVWKYDTPYGYYRTYAQLINLNNGILWEPEGRLLLQGGGTQQYSYWNNSLYVASLAAEGIYVHRFISGSPVWGPNGVLVGSPNLDYADVINFIYMSENQICWNQGTSNYWQMSFTNFFYEDGTTLYPPNQAAPTTPIVSEPYLGPMLSAVYRSGNYMVYALRYGYWQWTYDGHSDPGHWEVLYHPFFQRMNPDGSPMGEAIACGYNVLLFHNGVFYIDPDITTNTIPTMPLYGGEAQQISLQTGWIFEKLTSLSNQKILVGARHNLGGGVVERHFAFIGEDGNLEYCPDSVIGTKPILMTSVSDDGAWYLMVQDTSDYGHSGLYAQRLDWTSTGSDDPGLSPTAQISLQNYPNPFRDETQICVKLEEAAPITLKIFNIRGQLVRTIIKEEAIRGDNYLVWNGKDGTDRSCASGIYYLRAESAGVKASLRTLIIK